MKNQRFAQRAWLGVWAMGLAFVACEAPESGEHGDDSGPKDGDIDFGSAGGSSLGPGFGFEDMEPTENCGDGILDPNEACDDGNLAGDDGCGGNCRYVEPGFICPEAGEPCRAFAQCGDGRVVFPERCDDGNVSPGDGCNDICQVEIGWKCSVDDAGVTGCERTLCGDGIMEGAETCDDGNALPFDGCSPTCQVEPSCSDQGCTSTCGDGIVLPPEECDDGNTIGEDGCSADCQVEAELGYFCEQADPCEDISGECGLRLPIVYRDFAANHSDFAVECGDMVHGLVHSELSDGKPTLAKVDACISSEQSFAQWYTDTSVSETVGSSIVLFGDDNGAFVNRLNNEGTRYQRTEIRWCSDNAADGCPSHTCGAGYTECLAPCTPWGEGGSSKSCALYPQESIDGNPLFFPLDDLDGAPFRSAADLGTAQIPSELYGGGWQNEPSGDLHNFHFTSEIAHWFQYSAGEELNLSFIGDDDVWVFVNRRLAVDLGGLHVPIEGSFAVASDGTVTLETGHADPNVPPTVTTTTAAAFGLEDGGVYEIKVFHAERKRMGSSFKLTLSGFNTGRSACRAVCGDGILAAGEQCDDGEDNGGGYNRCSENCTLSTFCGDGIQQAEEECDDADPNAPAGCSGCRVIQVR